MRRPPPSGKARARPNPASMSVNAGSTAAPSDEAAAAGHVEEIARRPRRRWPGPVWRRRPRWRPAAWRARRTGRPSASDPPYPAPRRRCCPSDRRQRPRRPSPIRRQSSARPARARVASRRRAATAAPPAAAGRGGSPARYRLRAKSGTSASSHSASGRAQTRDVMPHLDDGPLRRACAGRPECRYPFGRR